MAYDPCDVAVLTASQDAATNGLNFPVIVHKVRLLAPTPATVSCSALLFDAATATGTEKIKVATDLYAAALARGTDDAVFDPPVMFNTGVSTTIAGSAGVKVFIYYKRP